MGRLFPGGCFELKMHIRDEEKVDECKVKVWAYGSKGDDGSGAIVDGKLSFLDVVNNHDSPKVILGVVPSSQDGFTIK